MVFNKLHPSGSHRSVADVYIVSSSVLFLQFTDASQSVYLVSKSEPYFNIVTDSTPIVYIVTDSPPIIYIVAGLEVLGTSQT